MTSCMDDVNKPYYMDFVFYTTCIYLWGCMARNSNIYYSNEYKHTECRCEIHLNNSHFFLHPFVVHLANRCFRHSQTTLGHYLSYFPAFLLPSWLWPWQSMSLNPISWRSHRSPASLIPLGAASSPPRSSAKLPWPGVL